MQNVLPPLAWPLGLAGLLPFLGLLVAVLLGQVWAAGALAAYGATILSFLGAVHWGLMLAAPGQAARTRLVGGVLPSLLAWVALLAPVRLGLGLLGLGMIALVVVETVATRRGLLPMAYLRLRWVLTAGAATALLAASFTVR